MMTQQPPPTLFIFAALECEAKPFIKHFDLKKEPNTQPVNIYKNNSCVLTVSGVGKVPMAAAVGFTLALFPNVIYPVMINIGIGGHKTQPLGNLCLASKITDTDSGKNFYPQLIGVNFPQCFTVRTSSQPCTNYTDEDIFDMEASAFYEIALKFSSKELIHCIKVISDNDASSINEIHPKLVTDWIGNHLLAIESLLDQWTTQSNTIKPFVLEEFTEIINKYHFSVSSQIKLKALLQRWNTLTNESWKPQNLKELKNSKTILDKLESDVNSLELLL